jgi:alpha-L-fucosidase
MGKWMKQYGETIYGTRSGPTGLKKWGVSTWKDNKVFVHILDAEDPVLYVPMAGPKVSKAYAFDSGEKITFRKQSDGVLLTLPEIPEDIIDYIIVLEF